MNPILTDEEIKAAVFAGIDECMGKPWLWTPERHDQTIATAAARRVVEWIAECITEQEGGMEYCMFCNDWAELKQEVGL